MSHNIADNYISNILSIQEDVIKRYEFNLHILDEAEKEKQDIIHEMELCDNFNACKGYKLAKAMRDNRKNRRLAKDENELLEEFYNFCKNQINIQNQLKNILGRSRQIFEKQQIRCYRPRVRTDLTITDIEPIRTEFGDILKDFKDKQKNRKKYKFA